MEEKNNYTLSVSASKDLRDFAKFSVKNFGIQQTEIYRDSLNGILNKLGENPEIGREYMAVKGKMLLKYRFKAHTIFFYPLGNKIFIVRILGNNMNFLKHL